MSVPLLVRVAITFHPVTIPGHLATLHTDMYKPIIQSIMLQLRPIGLYYLRKFFQLRLCSEDGNIGLLYRHSHWYVPT